ncbi:zinc-ribbon domain-containing protein [Eubacterium ruminantium]|nr:zinc-ribbon domain-containing protein [Eubacterium ruminantium]
MKVCRVCGKIIDDYEQFCPYCGNTTDEQMINEFMNRTTEKNSGVVPNTSTFFQNNDSNIIKQNGRKKEKGKKSGKKTWIILACVASAVVLLFGVILFLGFNAPDKDYYMDYFTGKNPDYDKATGEPEKYSFWYCIENITGEKGVYAYVTDLDIIDSEYKFFGGKSKVALTVEDSFLKRIVYANISISGIKGNWKVNNVSTSFKDSKIIELREEFIRKLVNEKIISDSQYNLNEYEPDRLASCTVEKHGTKPYTFSIKYDVTNIVDGIGNEGYVTIDGHIEVDSTFSDTDYSIDAVVSTDGVIAVNDSQESSSASNTENNQDSWPRKNPIEGLPDITNDKIYIYSGNHEFSEALQLYFANNYPEYKDYIEYVNLNKRFESDDYYNSVTEAFNSEKIPSIVVYNEDSVDKLNTEKYIDISTLGLTGYYANSYQYAIDRATYDGKLKAMSYLICPSGFFYRKDIAEAVFGTSEPEKIAEMVSDWSKFEETAEKVKQSGYYMLATAGDLARGFGKYSNDPEMTADQTEMIKVFKDNKYCKYESDMWGADWKNAFKEDVFGYFGALWFFDAAIDVYTDKVWKFCPAAEAYVWEGAYAGITNDCPNKGLAALVMYGVCCDSETQYEFAMRCNLTPNNTEAAHKIIDGGYTNYHNPWFEGNMAYYMDDIAKKLKIDK